MAPMLSIFTIIKEKKKLMIKKHCLCKISIWWWEEVKVCCVCVCVTDWVRERSEFSTQYSLVSLSISFFLSVPTMHTLSIKMEGGNGNRQWKDWKRKRETKRAREASRFGEEHKSMSHNVKVTKQKKHLKMQYEGRMHRGKKEQRGAPQLHKCWTLWIKSLSAVRGERSAGSPGWKQQG